MSRFVVSEDLVKLSAGNGVVTVTVNRPEKANSLTSDMLKLLRDGFNDLAIDDTLRAMVITGAGDRVFCAGADLTTLYDDQDGSDLWSEMTEALLNIPFPTIAAINGPCIGGGMSLALGCDIRLAVSQARFSYPVLKNNVIPGQYDVDRLHQLIGSGRAAVILFGGDEVPSEEALAWGLVDRVVPHDSLDEACRSLSAIATVSDGTHLKTLKSMLKKCPS
ncbi:MAG: enoyl-CoA hydratase/carnithine racemase [Parasphingorhabdus sp.]|jgi:enoyl-CoA hydratase/carnithine racemase